MGVQGAAFEVPFFSGSRSLALKLSLKSHQMTNFFIGNDEVFTRMKSLFSQYSFWMRKQEKNETTNSAPKAAYWYEIGALLQF